MKFRLKSWHFLLAIIVFVMAVNFITLSQNKVPASIEPNAIQEVAISDIGTIISDQTCAFLFCDPGSAAQKIVLRDLNRLNKEDSLKTIFYLVPVQDNPYIGNGITISGTPSILFFKDGCEINRIMGIVPYSNLKMIVERFEKFNYANK